MGRSRPDRHAGAGSDRDAARRRLSLLAAELVADRPPPSPGLSPGATGNDELPPDPQVQPAAGAGRHRAPALSARRRLAGAVADQLTVAPTRLSGDRGVTGQHVTVVALLVAALVTGGAWWVLSGRPQERAVVAPPRVQAPAASTPTVGAPASGEPSTGSEPAGPPAAPPAAPADSPAAGPVTGPAVQLVVDVAGRVRRPGLVTLPPGARVADAVQSAGGALPKVDLASVNLARPLVDGEQLLIGVRSATAGGAGPPAVGAAPSAPGAPGTAPALVDLNTATMEQLDTLPGVGPVTGQAILDWRTENGAFTSVDELLEVDGIGEVTLADLRDLVTVGPGAR